MTIYAAVVDVGSGPPAPLQAGKLPVALLGELLARLQTPPPSVLLGPRIGEDACAIEVPGGVLVAATDPITFTTQEIGRFSVIVNANDVAVMGVRPRWFLAVILLPSGTTEATVREVFASMQDSLAHVGAALVGGHTEVTQAVTQPVGVRNSDHPCDLRLRPSWPPARDGPIAPSRGPARGTCPRTECG